MIVVILTLLAVLAALVFVAALSSAQRLQREADAFYHSLHGGRDDVTLERDRVGA